MEWSWKLISNLLETEPSQKPLIWLTSSRNRTGDMSRRFCPTVYLILPWLESLGNPVFCFSVWVNVCTLNILVGAHVCEHTHACVHVEPRDWCWVSFSLHWEPGSLNETQNSLIYLMQWASLSWSSHFYHMLGLQVSHHSWHLCGCWR